MNSYIFDASFLLSFLLPDEKQQQNLIPLFQDFIDHKITVYAPLILRFEIVNALRSAIFQKRIDSKAAISLLDRFCQLPIHYLDIDLEKILKLSITLKLSAYDACYAIIALEENIPLMTFDKKLAQVVNQPVNTQ